MPEPSFTIAATDPLAVHGIIEYARRMERSGRPDDEVNDAFESAMEIAEWQRENPEKVNLSFEEAPKAKPKAKGKAKK